MQPQREERDLEANTGQSGKRRELILFLFITVVLFPILSVMIVGGYGFAVWIFQMFTGPPVA
ncbi:periplasmic nitrate reductase, NapE protein [Luteimonas sp. MC1750]|uniref:periplasmic nitrate reductase, NapE protein n=1 Tax=Luteimonas sp. MC1750 TaxID=2799326 RepID=UPI0018F1060B|nr:periplasmic nitrate reductase, NapE protein [Luteimonas sp. MC1750]MBJ6980182.1 periplasmic nitrate reductase, NapE protein [Luteimonas sp. MC1895]MBJ6985339.1 periplasmic nitrate reductase, NapE protein [Luteimonas sp. MC1750]QQO05399.1 periplasmic nitrate reductase, NapE protein [Luteimonas sp. MC1750]